MSRIRVVAILLTVLTGFSGLFYLREANPYSYAGAERFFEQIHHQYPFYDDGPTASVGVRQTVGAGGIDRTIVTDGKDDHAARRDHSTTALLGLVPCLLAERCERVFVIGYGLGVTAGELAALDGVRQVVVAEIARGVIDAAPYFDYVNQEASRNPKIRIVRGDAYRSLLRSDDRYDVIVSQPSNPWAGGIEMLYSLEFLQAVQERLAPGGVYAQWLHRYRQMDDSTFRLLMRTQTEVFRNAALWYAGTSYEFMLLGLDRPEIDLEQLERRVASPAFRRALARAEIRSLPGLLVHEALPVGVPNALQLGDRIHTLFRPRLNHVAAQAFFRGTGSTALPFSGSGKSARVGAHNSLLRRYAQRYGGTLPDHDRELAIVEACDRLQYVECAALLAQWQHDDPNSPRWARLAERARRSSPQIRGYLAPEVLRHLAGFYRNGSGPGAARSFDEARLSADLFTRFYFHGAPFDRGLLRRLRAASRTPGPQKLGARETEGATG